MVTYEELFAARGGLVANTTGRQLHPDLVHTLMRSAFIRHFRRVNTAIAWFNADAHPYEDSYLYGPLSWTGNLEGSEVLTRETVPESFWLVRLLQDAENTQYMTGRMRTVAAARFAIELTGDASLVAEDRAPFNAPAFWVRHVRQQSGLFKTLPQDLRDNIELATVACAQHAEASAHLSGRVLCNREFYNGLDRLTPVQFDYRLVPLELRRDLNVIRTALVADYFRFNDGDPDAAAFERSFNLNLISAEAVRTRGFEHTVARDLMMDQVRQYLRRAGGAIAARPQGGLQVDHEAAATAPEPVAAEREAVAVAQNGREHHQPGGGDANTPRPPAPTPNIQGNRDHQAG